ncbi:breast cancer metastasis-suppressor 1-like protein isoform X2 [Metopolophium dirhodum]|uniref:breast cancer metastasis-suppressor 1-like protein isoform X2 n=1 Tax=Metopolophium dirhodum TaxID=44670 RepID=UPI0029904C55|nr:breast cancer metastasis-suppressor 1-like protein isoform X2 [Metopolophium dirhodum]
MSSATSDNSDIPIRIQKIADKHEKSGSKVIVPKTVCTENVLDDPYDNEKLSELSISSTMSCSDSISSYDDSVDTSDLDEGENDRTDKKMQERLLAIEKCFDTLKTLLFNEKMKEVDRKLVEVRLGTAEEYLKPSQELKNQKEHKLELIKARRVVQSINAKNKYEAEKQAIIQNFENNKEILYDTIKADLEKKIQQLEEARNEVDIDAALWSGHSLTCSGRGRGHGRGRGRGKRPYGHVQPKQKPVIVSEPCIVYNLRENEILEDWISIKKSLLSSKRKENAEHRYKPYN